MPNPGYKTVLDIFFKFNTPYLIKTFPVLYCVLARPAFINSSATQSQGAAIFPKNKLRLFALASIYLHPSSMDRREDKGRRCCLGEGIHSIPCRNTDLAPV